MQVSVAKGKSKRLVASTSPRPDAVALSGHGASGCGDRPGGLPSLGPWARLRGTGGTAKPRLRGSGARGAGGFKAGGPKGGEGDGVAGRGASAVALKANRKETLINNMIL